MMKNENDAVKILSRYAATTTDKCLKEAIETVLQKETPLKAMFHKNQRTKHLWITDEFGEIDTFAFESGFHNGPVCRACGYSFCEHCNPEGYNDTNCVRSWYSCPICGETVDMNEKRCRNCGQTLLWGAKGLLELSYEGVSTTVSLPDDVIYQLGTTVGEIPKAVLDRYFERYSNEPLDAATLNKVKAELEREDDNEDD